jgi:fused signal recognition particle receptor
MFLAQMPLPPSQDAQTALNTTVIAIAAGAVVLVVLLVLVLRALLRKKPAPPPVIETRPAQELPAELPKVELPKTDLEQQRLAEAEEARRKAEESRSKRQALVAEGRADEAKQLKTEEEEAKKAAYRATKAAEAEEKDRHKREREEAERLRAEAIAKAKEEEERKAREAAEAEKQRVAAQAGQTLAQGLAKTRNEGFMAKLNGLFGGAPRAIDDKVLGELEEVLFTADIGVKTASSLVEVAREKARKNELDSADKLKGVIRKEVERIVDLKAQHRLSGGGPPHVIMVVGVNGSGKTTTIGKLAAKASADGKKVVLAAGDTFRAAAAEQLDVWADRAHAELVKGKDEADPASVIFEAVKKAREMNADLVIADTAGRLHTKLNLMEELKKVRRVIDKALPGAPHEVLLVLDSTNGQNAIAQAKQFNEAVGVTGIALTKLDGTAKGGVIIGICDELKVPVAWAGVGEKVEDLKPFEPREFVQALFD